MLPAVPTNYKPKSFWNRPEGTTGMIMLALCGVLAVFAGNAFLPYLATFFNLLAGTFNAAIAATLSGLALAAIVYVVLNKKVQTLVKYFFKSAMRFLTGLLVEIDPIGIMRGYISTLADKLNDLRDGKSRLSGEIRICKEKISKNAAEANHALKMAAEARNVAVSASSKGDQDQLLSAKSQMGVNSNQHGRLIALNQRLEATLVKMEMLYRALVRYETAAANAIKDIKNEVDVREQERNMIRTSHRAMSSAMSILQGSGSEHELFEQAMEYTAEEYGRKLGEIEDFMDSTKTILDGIDLQNGVWQAEAMEKLTAFESKTESILLGGERRIMIENAASHSLPSRMPSSTDSDAVLVGAEQDYQKFFPASGRK